MRSVRDRQTARLAADRINQASAVLEQQANIAPRLPGVASREKREIMKKFEHRLRGLNYSTGYRAGRASQGEPTMIAASQRYIRAVNRLKPYLR